MDHRPPTDAERVFAAQTLEKLLHSIEVGNANAAAYPRRGRYTFWVSAAWTDGAALRLVYRTPPSDRVWGLARDTRESLISPTGWSDNEDAPLYYYLLDLEEDWPGRWSRLPGEDPDLIWWQGDRLDDLPQRSSDLAARHRYTPPAPDPAWVDHTPPVVNEPRRYADPNGPLPPGVDRCTLNDFTSGRAEGFPDR